MKKTKKGHERGPGETQITISLPESLKDELTALAAQDERSRSNWIVRELKAIVARKRAEKGGATISRITRAAANIITVSFCSAILQSVPKLSFA